MQASHHAGMAEVATDVLHNVGNVLNSVNVAVSLIREKLALSKISYLQKVAEMLEEHSENVTEFLTENPRGNRIPGYLIKLTRLLTAEQDNITQKLRELDDNVQNIKEIIQTQQTYAKTGGVEVAVSLVEVIENAIQINEAGLYRHQITLIREFNKIEDVYIDKQKVIQIFR